jgi:putative hydrolase of the HAD superfamily
LIKAVTFDLWNTLLVEKSYTDRRLEILGEALTTEGHRFDPAALRDAYKTAQRRHDDLWSRSHSHYPLAERLDDIIAGVDATLSPAKKLEVMDRFGGTILENPPPLTEGAVETVSKMAKVFRLGIISDTGITSGAKISELLDRCGILRFFTAKVWSDETGVAKPRREAFEIALKGLKAEPAEAMHVGDLLRTDVAGAKAAGMMGVWLKIREPDAEGVTPDYMIEKINGMLEIPEVSARLSRRA